MDSASGPWVESVARDAGCIVIKLKGLGSEGIQLHNTTGFEVLVNDGGVKSPGVWMNTPITSHTHDSVTIGPIPANATKIRYLWYGDACGLECFQCAVYTGAQILGELTGELDFLPLPPFIQALPEPEVLLIV